MIISDASPNYQTSPKRLGRVCLSTSLRPAWFSVLSHIVRTYRAKPKTTKPRYYTATVTRILHTSKRTRSLTVTSYYYYPIYNIFAQRTFWYKWLSCKSTLRHAIRRQKVVPIRSILTLLASHLDVLRIGYTNHDMARVLFRWILLRWSFLKGEYTPLRLIQQSHCTNGVFSKKEGRYQLP